VTQLIDLFLHVDRHLLELVADYGVWIYAILFLIVFAETGLVVTPFLPGDSLLFAAGALGATGALNVWLAAALLLGAAIAGDAVNYAVGRSVGEARPAPDRGVSTVGTRAQADPPYVSRRRRSDRRVQHRDLLPHFS